MSKKICTFTESIYIRDGFEEEEDYYTFDEETQEYSLFPLSLPKYTHLGNIEVPIYAKENERGGIELSTSVDGAIETFVKNVNTVMKGRK